MLGFKAIAKLHQKKYRQEYGVYLVEGKKAVLDALESSAQVQQLVITDQFSSQQPDFVAHAAVKPFFKTQKILKLSQGEFNVISDTKTPQGIAAVVKTPQTALKSWLTELQTNSAQPTQSLDIAIFEDIRDPGNLGTMIRTADWFGVAGVLCIHGADPYQSKVVRSSMGSIFHVPIFLSEDGLDELELFKENNFEVIVTRPELADSSALAAQSADLAQLQALPKRCLVFGNEAHGTSRIMDQAADRYYSIPRYGRAESLNVAMSFGIMLSQLKTSYEKTNLGA